MISRSFKWALFSPRFLVLALFPILAAVISCRSLEDGSGSRRVEAAEADVLPAPEIISPLYQAVKYSGEPRPFAVVFEGGAEAPFEVYYYASGNERMLDQNGSAEAPLNPGFYSVKIKRPEGNGYGEGEDVLAGYLIEKAALAILAEEKQSAFYNGDPKRVSAIAVPPLPLSFSYYPSAEVRRAALDALLLRDEASVSAASTALSAFRRVERAPVEQGVYYVLVYYPGDEYYELSYREIEFTITPPERPRRAIPPGS